MPYVLLARRNVERGALVLLRWPPAKEAGRMSGEDRKTQQAERARKLNAEIDRLVESGKNGAQAAPRPRTPRDLAEEGAEEARKDAKKGKTGP